MGKMQSNDQEEIKRLHPRFAELKTFHGIEDEKPTSSTSGPQKMSSGLINITLKCVGPSMGEKQPLTKKLPPTTTVSTCWYYLAILNLSGCRLLSLGWF